MRTLVERLVREELFASLGAGPYERTSERRGYQHSPRERTITTGLGPVTLRVPRGRLFTTPAGGSKEWQSELLPRYARRTREVDAALAGLMSDLGAGRECPAQELWRDAQAGSRPRPPQVHHASPVPRWAIDANPPTSHLPAAHHAE